MIVVVAAVFFVTRWLPDLRMSAARASWEPPPQAMLSSSMREQPVPGWRAAVSDLGLPATGESRIAVSNDPRGPRPFIGSIDSVPTFWRVAVHRMCRSGG